MMTLLASDDVLLSLVLSSFLVVVAGVASAGVYATVRMVMNKRLAQQARENNDRLKALMIQRGMTADEIERVLKLEANLPDLPNVKRKAPHRRNPWECGC